MPVRADTKNIPTVAVSIDEYVLAQRAVGRKSVKDHVSVLQGAKNRVVGKKAAGPALAHSELGQLRADRVTAVLLLDWFWLRHRGLAAATSKRGMSSLRGWAKYCIGQGYMDERVLDGLFQVLVSDSPAARDWLYPERLQAFTQLVNTHEMFDDYDRFAWLTEFALGTRTAETVLLQPRSLDPIAKVVTVSGKGHGDGKSRDIPVDDIYIEAWHNHIKRHDIRPNAWMLYWRGLRACGGAVGALELHIDKTKPLSHKSLRTFMNRVAGVGAEELPSQLVPEFSLTPKVARRTFACTQLILHELNRGGLDLDSLKDAMGHSRLDVTERYLTDVRSYLNLIRRPTNTITAADQIIDARRNLD